MGSNHARVISELPEVELAGIVDIDRHQALNVSRSLGCRAFENLDA
jgi:UDP-N-acetylglucosamine 3-dehydrogenase